MNNKIPLPEESCAYEKYDPISLKPLNIATSIRLAELDLSAQEFCGKSVLDIGCNTGALSIFTHKLGASNIHAIDVQGPLINFFKRVVDSHGLNILVEKKNFDLLDPINESADIVLMMEVLHWLVDQGHIVSEVVEKLAALTNEILYLETPWDVNEPSIAKKGVITDSEYNMASIVGELSKYFEDVRFIRFMTYFGKMKGSKRILIKASKKRLSNAALSKLDNVYPIDIDLTRGRNKIRLLASLDGPLVLKSIPKNSIFIKLESEYQSELVDLLPANGLIPPPLLIGNSYVYSERNGECHMIFPFLGRLNNYLSVYGEKVFLDSPSVDLILNTAIECRKILRQASEGLVNRVTLISGKKKKRDIEKLRSTLNSRLNSKLVDKDYFWDRLQNLYLASDLNFDQTLIHADIQMGNIIQDMDGNIHLIDLDLIRTGTIYSDLIIAGIFSGCTLNQLKSAVNIQALKEDRLPLIEDVVFSAIYILGWLESVSVLTNIDINQTIERALKGLDTAEEYFQYLGGIN